MSTATPPIAPPIAPPTDAPASPEPTTAMVPLVRGPARRAPGPKGLPVLGSLLDMKRQGILEMYMDAWRRYGDVVRFQMGPVTIHLVVRPEHVRHVFVDHRERYTKGFGWSKFKLLVRLGLVTSEGDLWKRQRVMLQPPFTKEGVTGFFELMRDACDATLADWEPAAATGGAREVNADMMRLAMRIVSQTMFAQDCGDEAIEAAAAMTEALEFISARTVTLFDVPMFIPTRDNRRFKRAMGIVDKLIHRFIEDGRRRGGGGRDLLSMMLRARENGQGMSDEQLRDEVVTVFFAGHETTAQTLTWAFYLLSKNPEAQRKLSEEADRVLGARTPTLADMENLPYARMVVQETLRLYPPAWTIPRDAAVDDEIGGYAIPKGSMVIACQYIAHRHPEFWHNPEGFDPERFTEERSEGRPRHAYFPFGAGPRTCIGQHFAMLEATLFLAMAARRYHLTLEPCFPVVAKAVGTLRPAHGLRMNVHRRA